MKLPVYGMIIILLMSSCVSKEEKAKTMSFSGAFALYPMAIKWSDEYKQSNAEVRFNISAGGAGKGMTDALDGTVDLGMFSREIMQEEKDKGVWWVAVCKDAVLPTISTNNKYLPELKERGITRDEFKAIYIDKTIESWGELLGTSNPQKIVSYTRSDASGAAATWAKWLGGKQDDLNGVGLHGDPALAQAVGKDNLAIGYNNTIYVYDIKTGEKRKGIDVIPIDLNANGKVDPEEKLYKNFGTILKAISDGRYPSPPARDLYFVANGKPEKQATKGFLEWVLTKGQKFVPEAGYVPLTQEKINHNLNKLQ